MMSTSARSYLVAGAAAATATAIALAPVQALPADIAVPAHPTSTQPELSQAMIDLLAAASRMTAAVTPKTPSSGAPALGIAPAAAVGGEVGVQNAASDWLTSAYRFIQYWVDYGVELADWILGWIPGGYLIGDQINIFYGSLIRPVADSVFYDLIVPVVNNPLNLGVWANGIGDIAVSTVNGLISLGVNEFNYFFGWIIPPLPIPPFPPFPGLATAQILAASPGALFPNLRGLVGDLVLPPADFVTDLATNTINGAYGAVHNATSFVVDGADNVLDALRLGFVGRQLDINYDLLSSLSSEGVGLTTDLINVPDRYLNDVLANGQGIFQAVGTEARFVADSITDHGSGALNAFGKYVDDQINYFTPGFAATNTKEVTTIPPSARVSLLSPTDTTPVKDAVDSVGSSTGKLAGAVTDEQDRAKDRAAKLQSRVQSQVKNTVDGAKQAREDARDAVKSAVKNLTPKAKTKEKAQATKAASADQSKDNGKTAKSGKDKK